MQLGRRALFVPPQTRGPMTRSMSVTWAGRASRLAATS